MAPFNWFNRSNTPPSQQPDAAPEATSSDSPSGSSSPEQETPQTEEKLDWAKAAYQMIQKRKAEEAAGSQAMQASAAEPAVAPPESTQAESSETEPTQTEATETEVTEIESIGTKSAETKASETEAAQTNTPEPQISDADLVDAGAVETVSGEERAPIAPQPASQTDTNATALPFWAQADAERQQRIEQLKATAIDDTPPPTAAEADETDVGVTFDEDFVWSANVLAAQGRRPDDISVEEINWLTKLRQGLGKTRRSLVNQLRAVVGQGPLNDEAVMEIESLLLQADVGIDATDYIIEALQDKLRREALPPEAAIAYLKQIIRDILEQPYQDGYSPTFAPQKGELNVWLLTGVNGAGKTTTVGKLAHLSRKSDYSCLIAAADTFRAAAVEQVKIWGQRSGVDVIANPGKNTDPAAVVFDAIAAAQSRSADVLLVDTAGRLQNKKNLMDELSKIRRIIDKKATNASVESLLVLDATLGQNGLQQAKVFSEAAQLSGVVLTKLDGTAKGGVALAVVQQLGLPIRFIGAGEGIEDLRPFSSYEFVEALLNG